MHHSKFPFALTYVSDGHGRTLLVRKTLASTPDGGIEIQKPMIHPVGGRNWESPETYVRRTDRNDFLALLESIDEEVAGIEQVLEDTNYPAFPAHHRLKAIRPHVNQINTLLHGAANDE